MEPKGRAQAPHDGRTLGIDGVKKNRGYGVTNLPHLSWITFPPTSALHKTRGIGERKATRHQTGDTFRMRGQNRGLIMACSCRRNGSRMAYDVRLGLERI